MERANLFVFFNEDENSWSYRQQARGARNKLSVNIKFFVYVEIIAFDVIKFFLLRQTHTHTILIRYWISNISI